MQQKEALIELTNLDLVNGKETLEEASENYMNKKGHIPTTDLEDAIFKQGFLDGAKWQQERMYSEIDLEVAFFEGRENSLTIIEWFEQFKNK
jgi:hypothetical protein